MQARLPHAPPPATPGYHRCVRPHLASLVDDLRHHPSEIAVVVHRGNRRYPTTYGQLAHLTGRIAAELDRRALVPGDRLLLWGQNSAPWIAAFFACLLRGVLVVPLDAAGSPAFAARVLADTSPKLLLADPNLLRQLPLPADLPALSLADLDSTLPPQPNYTVSPAVTLDTPFQIIFTSGTTADPKGIVHTHRNVLASLQPIEDQIARNRRYERWFHPLRFLHTLPLSHVFGQFMGLWIPALLSAELHLTDQLDPTRATHLIHRERISVLIAVPRVLELLRAHLLTRFPNLPAQLEAAKDLSIAKRLWRFRAVHRALGWKFWAVLSGGATLPTDLESFWNRLGIAVIQGYGLTETAALVTLNHPFRIGRGTIGKLLPGRELRLSDEGEILVRGDMLAPSTWHSGAMHPRASDWLATGDLASRSDSGELRFLGRMGDVIVTRSGLNIHPSDLEAALAAQPGLQAAVVVPCPTPTGTEPVAVVLSNHSDVQLQTAIQNANRTLADFQQIRRVLRWPHLQLPYTSTGKLLRRTVADWACATLAAATQPGTATPNPTQAPLLNLIATITGEPSPITADPDQLRLSEDLHLDSLGRVQLQSTLEQRLGLQLPDDVITTVPTLGVLRNLLNPPTEANTTPLTLSTAPSAPLPPSPPPETATYPHWPWTAPIQALRALFLELFARPLVWLLAAPRVINETTREAPATPVLILANHVTAYDGALILYALPPKLRRHVAIAMSGEMLLDLRHGRNQVNAFLNTLAPAVYWLLTALFNVFPLPRLRGFRASFAHAGEAMDRGYSVLIFPEGTRSQDGQLHPFRPGIGLLAQQSQAPILPVALLGLHEARARKHWFRPGGLIIRLGTLIPPNPTASPEQLTTQLEAAVRQLLEEYPQAVC
jgi:long-chain acyl-CoA synthetase